MSSPLPPDQRPSQPNLPNDALAEGHIFAGYQIVGLLGSGGMGRVYLAQHPRLPRRDALKLLPRDWSADADYRARFNREADLASTLWHPNIVGVHDRGEDDGQLWISMDFVDGLDASRLIAERYPTGMPAGDVAHIITAVARALDSAHERGLLHRDVKPANIMLTHLDDEGEQRILLTDFGLARDVNDDTGFSASDMTLGTVAYFAPEQLLGEDVDRPADQYALAATAYHLLTGGPLVPTCTRPPFPAPTLTAPKLSAPDVGKAPIGDADVDPPSSPLATPPPHRPSNPPLRRGMENRRRNGTARRLTSLRERRRPACICKLRPEPVQRRRAPRRRPGWVR